MALRVVKDAADVSRWQAGIQVPDETSSELRTIALLTTSTRQFLSSILKLLASNSGQIDSINYETLRGQFIDYFFWYEGFSLVPGGLDRLLSKSQFLKATVLKLMVAWARTFMRGTFDILVAFDVFYSTIILFEQ